MMPKLFKKNLILKEGDILGFVDESSQNINSNTERLWSFKELKMKKITRMSEPIA